MARAEERDDAALHRDEVCARLPAGSAAFALAPRGAAVGLAVLTRASDAAPAAAAAAGAGGSAPPSSREAGTTTHAAGDGLACGFFCVVTRRDARRRGLAAAVLAGLADWARGAGAGTADLHVLTTNAEAHALYARAGFARSHGSVDRTAPTGIPIA